MITAARRLFREHGYVGTASSDVITESGAPRGSLHFHFRGGKEELATEVALHQAADCIAHINRVAGNTDTAAQFIRQFIGGLRDEIVASGYREGCAIAHHPALRRHHRGPHRPPEEKEPAEPEHAHDLASLAVTTPWKAPSS